MTDPMIRAQQVREFIVEQRKLLPPVNNQGRPTGQPTQAELDMLRDDEKWQKFGPGWQEKKRHAEAQAAGLNPAPTVPELDGTLTPAERQTAADQLNAAVTAATTPAPPAPTTTQPRAPRPDKSQGGGGGGGASYETQIADAQKR
ncbi:MAG TPA: hypothetical protein VJT49_20130, partial [Amycolatopsis sp.]|uniref:hypothetical protein n=1 Tax=Amycolatopsis sp. TaxID=37632 RepID=UPI002B474CAB